MMRHMFFPSIAKGKGDCYPFPILTEHTEDALLENRELRVGVWGRAVRLEYKKKQKYHIRKCHSETITFVIT